MTHPNIPLGHTVPAHQAFGWCAHCPDHTVAEELAAWQTREPADDVTRLRTENERLRHELEVMHGGAFDSLEKPKVPAETLRRLVQVAQHVSRGRGAADIGHYPDATARRALGDLHEAGLLYEAGLLPVLGVTEATGEVR